MGIVSNAVERLTRGSAVVADTDRFRAEVVIPDPAVMPPASASSGGPLALGASQWFVPRRLALSVPTVKRCRNVIAGSIASMDLARWHEGRRIPEPVGTDDVTDTFLRRPQPDRTRAWLIAWTIEDLIFYDRAHWMIKAFRGGTRTPAAVERVAPEEVTGGPKSADGKWQVRGKPVDPRNMITFDGSGIGGILSTSAVTILTAIDLEAASGRYARNPIPNTVLANLGQELDDTEQEELLTAWETARAKRSTAFINANVDVKTQGWSAKELQLVEGRQHVALELARVMNVPAHYAMAPAPDSMTYSNVQDDRRELADVSLQPYMDIIGQTLSVDAAHDVGWTCCATGRSIALDPSVFLRLSDLERANLWASLTGSGVLEVADAQELEPLSPRRNPNA